MRITNDAGCGVPECAVDLGPNCQPSVKISRDLLLNLYCRQAPHNSKDHSTQLDSLLGARVPAKRASHLTRTMTRIVAQEDTTLLQPVRPRAFSIILTSVSSLLVPSHTLSNLTESQNQLALIHTCMRMMSRAALLFSRVPRRNRRIIPLHSAPKLKAIRLPFDPFSFLEWV